MPTPDIRAAGQQLPEIPLRFPDSFRLHSGFAGRAPGERALLHIACSMDDTPCMACRLWLVACGFCLYGFCLYGFCLYGFCLYFCICPFKRPDQKKMGETPIFFYSQVVGPGAQIKAARPATSRL
jgi:hypothetical protein